ncbi:MAG: hypothetical protein ACK559_42350, partial [bacterium]
MPPAAVGGPAVDAVERHPVRMAGPLDGHARVPVQVVARHPRAAQRAHGHPEETHDARCHRVHDRGRERRERAEAHRE